jgi:hypothetical protein
VNDVVLCEMLLGLTVSDRNGVCVWYVEIKILILLRSVWTI